MRVVIVLALFLLAACSVTPYPPTGNAIAPPTHYRDGTVTLIATEQIASLAGEDAVRITVKGDVVFTDVYVNDVRYELRGEHHSDGWLADSGHALVHLSSGEHEITAYSCFDEGLAWKCGCVNEDNCGNWMKQTILVN